MNRFGLTVSICHPTKDNPFVPNRCRRCAPRSRSRSAASPWPPPSGVGRYAAAPRHTGLRPTGVVGHSISGCGVLGLSFGLSPPFLRSQECRNPGPVPRFGPFLFGFTIHRNVVRTELNEVLKPAGMVKRDGVMASDGCAFSKLSIQGGLDVFEVHAGQRVSEGQLPHQYPRSRRRPPPRSFP